MSRIYFGDAFPSKRPTGKSVPLYEPGFAKRV
jgi:hypothetical protein